jgi:hypothetical protein
MKSAILTAVSSIIIVFVCILFVAGVSAQTNLPKLTDAQGKEMMMMVKSINHLTLPYKATAMQQMLNEANFFADRLKLPTPHPIKMTDVVFPHVSPPWFSIIKQTNVPYLPATIFGADIFNADIPREQRLRALNIAVRGQIETTNFFFSFLDGRLCDVERLSEHEVERYARDLDKLVGQSSLIDTNDAYQLATQWLAAVDVDMPALNKLKWTVSQLHYMPHGATNAVTLPLYYVDFGSKHTSAQNNLPASDEPLISVEILGTTKELQELRFQDTSFSRRSQMFITNAFELVRTLAPAIN